jgi:hypothetical protein
MIEHTDSTGRTVKVGDIVRSGDTLYRVAIVEGPIPGSRVTREGRGTLYLQGPDGSYIVETADSVTVDLARAYDANPAPGYVVESAAQRSGRILRNGRNA